MLSNAKMILIVLKNWINFDHKHVVQENVAGPQGDLSGRDLLLPLLCYLSNNSGETGLFLVLALFPIVIFLSSFLPPPLQLLIN